MSLPSNKNTLVNYGTWAENGGFQSLLKIQFGSFEVIRIWGNLRYVRGQLLRNDHKIIQDKFIQNGGWFYANIATSASINSQHPTHLHPHFLKYYKIKSTTLRETGSGRLEYSCCIYKSIKKVVILQMITVYCRNILLIKTNSLVSE